MRKFTYLLLTAALLIVGVGTVNAGKLHATLSSSNWWAQADWNSETNTMSWVSSWELPSGGDGTWRFIETGFANCDITSYTKFHATLSNFSDNVDHIWLRIKQGDNNYADAKLFAGENNIDLAALAAANPDVDFSKVTDITLWGAREALEGKTIGSGENTASVVITNVYLYKSTDVVTCTGFGEAVTSLDYITDGGKFVISDDGTKAKYFYTNNENQNAIVGDVPSDAYFYFTLEKYDGGDIPNTTEPADNIYKIKITNADGDGYPRGSDGVNNYYLNAVLGYTDVVISGTKNGWGGDKKDALWYVTYDAEKGFSFQNVYRSENSSKSWLPISNNFVADQQYLRIYKSIGFNVNTEVDPIDENVEITVDAETRNYQLYVPGNVADNCPLVISLHGANGASTNYIPFTREVAAAQGCIVAYPQGKSTYFPIGFGGDATGWTATGEDNFDVEFLKAVIEDVASKYQIDRKRIYCCGFSNGGMMTYALSNTCSDIFAAFASISGYPINEFHLRHTGARPVPFLYIHGKEDDFVKYSKMPTIVDEMVARLGANPVPTSNTVSGKYTKNVYEAGDGSFPYVYYEVDGMGHEAFTNNTDDGNSALTMWNFFKDYTLDSPSDETLKWAPRIEEDGYAPAEHGWTMNSGTTLLQFGGDYQYTVDNKNVYHSLQLDNGEYKLCFNSTGAAVSMGVQIQKLTSPNTVVLDETVNVGENAELPFEVTDDWGEYQLTITRPSESDAITISNVVIKEGSWTGGETSDGNKYLEITTDVVKANTWEWAIWYDLETPLVKDEKYVLTMDAICSESYNMSFWPNKKGGGTTYTGYNIGTEWASCKCEFTAGDDIDRLSWNFGSLNGFLRFDNVKLVKKGESTNLITGGDFESGLDSHWGDDGWNKPEYELYETAAKPSKYLKITTNEAKANAWEWAIWYQLTSPLVEGKTYVLSMDAKCSETYNMSFWPCNTAEGGKTKYTGYNIGTEWSSCACEFEANDALNRLVWNFGSLNGFLYFDNVKLVEKGKTTNLMTGGDFEAGLDANWGNDGWNKPDYGVVMEYPEVTAEVPIPEIDLTSSFYNNPGACTVNVSNEPQGEGSLIFGDSNVHYSNYADLSSCSGIKFYGSGGSVRVLYNRPEGEGNGGPCPELSVTPTEEGTLLDISSLQPFNLNAIKVNWGNTVTVTKVSVIDPSVSADVDYVLSGDIKDGKRSSVVIAAFADGNAKVIDVTGVTGSGVELTSANPNCLFVANAGTLTNANNLIVDDVCGNLVLTDNYPFKAPADFMATSATYNTTINATAECGTLCLPFAATIPDGVTAYTLAYTSGNAATATPVETTIPANTPVLLNGSGEKTFNGSNVAIEADATNIYGALTGVFQQGYVPQNSYVLQKKAESEAGFYKVAAENAITIKPFRAYLSADAGVKEFLSINFDEATSISQVQGSGFKVQDSEIFNLAGQRMSKLQKGVNIVNGKKVLVK